MRPAPFQVVWFKRDLRIEDHAPLVEAARAGRVLPLFIVEPAYWRQPDVSGRQHAFLAECIASLARAIGGLGGRLVVRVGEAVAVLDDIDRAEGIAALWSHEETGNRWTYDRDRAVLAWTRGRAIPWHEMRQDGVVRRLASRDGWAKRWDRQMAAPILEPPARLEAPPIAIAGERFPSARDLGVVDDPCSERQPGGRAAAIERLSSFLDDRCQTYRRAMSQPLEGAHACSRLSPHLAFGTLSMREIAQATAARRRDVRGRPGAAAQAVRASLASFSGRLHWHCHFMQKLESEPAIEHVELHPGLRGLRPGPADTDLLAAWQSGATGYPFLDACMRSLAATGWLNFRMRAMVMSFASYNLWLPWRESGLHLARQFTDYEPGIHWPQVQMQSGTTGINTVRIYNVVKQGYDQDASGAFVRRWVPELSSVPDAHLQEPWTWGGASALLGKRYPDRIVDLAVSTALAKERIFTARQGRVFHDAADRIQEKHGSRRSGIPLTGQRRIQDATKRTRRTPTPGQLEFDV